MKIAVIGQSVFGAEVFKLLKSRGHEIVGVFTLPDTKGKPDVLGKDAEPLLFSFFRTFRILAVLKCIV